MECKTKMRTALPTSNSYSLKKKKNQLRKSNYLIEDGSEE
jgi:hypothetical protein